MRVRFACVLLGGGRRGEGVVMLAHSYESTAGKASPWSKQPGQQQQHHTQNKNKKTELAHTKIPHPPNQTNPSTRTLIEALTRM